MLSRRTFVRSCLATGNILALSGCSNTTNNAAENSVGSQSLPEGGTLYFYIDNPLAIDPYNCQESEGRKVQVSLFDALTAYDWEKGILVGKAAESWEANDAETEFTFHLVHDATFHNGEPVTAQSFKRAWERICDPKMNPPSAIRYHLDPVRGASQMARGDAQQIEGVRATDDYTLVVTLSAPMADFPYVCSHPSLAPVPQAALDDPQGFMMQPIGNGPFKMDGPWVPDQRIRIVRYDGYYGTPAKIDAVEFHILENPGTAFREFEAGHIDFTPIAAGRFGEISMNYGMAEDGYTVSPGAQTLTGTECSVYYLMLNCKDETLRDPTIRRAISLAINRDNINHAIFGGTYSVADTIMPPVLDDDPANKWEDSHYDAEAARKLLDKDHPANANGGRNLHIRLSFNQGGGHDDIINMIATDLQAVGITVELDSTEWTAYSDALSKGDFQVARFGWFADYPIMDNFLYPLFYSSSESNSSGYSNLDIDSALLATREIADTEERKQAYRNICARIGQEMPVVPLLFYSHNHVGSKRVNRLYYDPQSIPHFEDASVS